MDWSLGQPSAKKPFLRDTRAFKQTWPYHLSMLLDPVLRFNWIFYAIYTHDVQHSSTASFFVAFTEILRRGMWTIFRVENEHCANVTRFKASRDIPLPYSVDVSDAEDVVAEQQNNSNSTAVDQQINTSSSSPTLSRRKSRVATLADVEEGHSVENDNDSTRSGRFRGTARTITRLLANAHTKDFEKKRRSVLDDGENVKSRTGNKDSVSDSDDDLVGRDGPSTDEEEDELDVLDAIDVRGLTGRGERRGSSSPTEEAGERSR